MRDFSAKAGDIPKGDDQSVITGIPRQHGSRIRGIVVIHEAEQDARRRGIPLDDSDV